MNLYKRFTARLAAGVLACAILTTSALAASGTVEAVEGLHLRAGAATTDSILTTLPYGAQVEVLGTAGEDWFQVTYQGLTGYAARAYLTLEEGAEAQLPEADELLYGRVTAGPLNVRSLPSTDGDKVRQLYAGSVVQITETLDGWYAISDGYICADYVQIVDPSEVAFSTTGAQVAAYAQQFVGCPYAYGGTTTRGFDCSGFTMFVYSHFGISLSHASSSQINSGTPVSRSELQPGDLLCFSWGGSVSHVGIYIGGGSFVHAATSSKGVVITSLSAFPMNLIAARRVL